MNATDKTEQTGTEEATGLVHRQGDVALVKVDALPAGARKVEAEGPVILAHGEVTGHAHRIETPGATLYREGTKTYLTADQLLELTHEEHTTQQIEPGVYEVRRQREYSPQANRWVAD